MRFKSDYLQARLLAVGIVFLISACVINRSSDTASTTADAGDDPAAAPAAATPVVKALPPSAPATAAVADKKPAATKTPAKRPAHVSSSKVATTSKAKLPAKTVDAPGASGEKLVRYVSAEVLNVHATPRADAPVIAKLTRGSMFNVMVTGEWAKLGEGQYVLVRYLSRNQPQTEAKSLVMRK